MSLELKAMEWLRWEKKCEIIIRERCPRYYSGNPDVIGITKHRYVLEIEVKRSVGDFKADFQKRHRINREHHLEEMPKFFWYLVPEKILEKVQFHLPIWAGLMFVEEETSQIKVKIKAPQNKLAKRLTPKEWVRSVYMMANHLLASERSRHYESSRFRDGCWDYTPAGVTNYQI